MLAAVRWQCSGTKCGLRRAMLMDAAWRSVLCWRSCFGNAQAQNAGGNVQWYWIGAEGCVCVSGRLVIVPWRSAELISIILLMQ